MMRDFEGGGGEEEVVVEVFGLSKKSKTSFTMVSGGDGDHRHAYRVEVRVVVDEGGPVIQFCILFLVYTGPLLV